MSYNFLKEELNHLFTQMWKEEDPNHKFPEALDKIELIIPTEGLMFDYFYHFKQKGLWKHWQDSLKGLKPVEGASMIIPTIDTLRYMHILDMHIKVRILLRFIYLINVNHLLVAQHANVIGWSNRHRQKPLYSK